MRYAEVIGDPIAQSKSPAIHKYWLEQLDADGDYRAQLVPPAGLADYLASRRQDPDWRGCNVTIPHKEAVSALVDELTPEAGAIGAVNCVVPEGRRLIGHNTDVDGIAAALDSEAVDGQEAIIIGAGGAARSMLAYLSRRKPSWVIVMARSIERAEPLLHAGFDIGLAISPFSDPDGTFSGAGLIANASPLGMMGNGVMSSELLSAVEANARGAVIFDMVYNPLETEFLTRGAAGGGRPVDGLTMLIGQARRAFSLFFGLEAPTGDVDVRAILTAPAEQTLSRTA